jgi:phospholipase/carboxylesterase
MYHSTKNLLEKGIKTGEAKKALIMLHGRGATASDIITLSDDLSVNDFHIFAPQASNQTWYPYTFLAPVELNQPWLDSAISIIDEIVGKNIQAGLKHHQLFFLGFSQGACLALEYTARNARHWGGIIAFSGGLIGDSIREETYTGDFNKTRVFIGNSNIDPHIPLKRCEDSADLLTRMGADVKLSIYPDMGHYINNQEIAEANLILASS